MYVPGARESLKCTYICMSVNLWKYLNIYDYIFFTTHGTSELCSPIKPFSLFAKADGY